MNGDEIVRYIVTETLAKGMPDASPDEIRANADALVVRFLREFGGARVYLPMQDRRLLLEARARIFAEALSSSKPTAVLLRDGGISRRTLYRLLKRGPPDLKG